jgi:DNA-binding MarR family transcriptional regulator
MERFIQPLFNFPSINIQNQDIYKSISSSRRKNYDTYHTIPLRCFSKKQGPKDGWDGITLKILNYIAKRNGCSIKELCEVFNIARQNIHYHINKLLIAGKIERWPPYAKKHDPSVIYVPKSYRLESSPFNGASYSSSNSPLNTLVSQKAGAFKIFKKSRSNFIASQIIKILSIRPHHPRKLAEKLNIPMRTLRYYTNKLIKAGLIVRAGGNNCKYAYLIFSPNSANLFHSHKYTKYHRRYRRNNSKG